MAFTALQRVLRDVDQASKTTEPGLFFIPNEDLAGDHHFMIVGPEDSPYHNSIFLFSLKLPGVYPMKPPTVQFLSSTVRIHPNLYVEGKVCLSILGTWQGEGWYPLMSIEKVMLQIQCLLENDALRNEPGHKNATAKLCKQYDDFVRYACFERTLELFHQAVNERSTLTKLFKEPILHFIREKQDFFTETIENIGTSDGNWTETQTFTSPYYRKTTKKVHKARLQDLWNDTQSKL